MAGSAAIGYGEWPARLQERLRVDSPQGPRWHDEVPREGSDRYLGGVPVMYVTGLEGTGERMALYARGAGLEPWGQPAFRWPVRDWRWVESHGWPEVLLAAGEDMQRYLPPELEKIEPLLKQPDPYRVDGRLELGIEGTTAYDGGVMVWFSVVVLEGCRWWVNGSVHPDEAAGLKLRELHRRAWGEARQNLGRMSRQLPEYRIVPVEGMAGGHRGGKELPVDRSGRPEVPKRTGEFVMPVFPPGHPLHDPAAEPGKPVIHRRRGEGRVL